MKKTSRWTAALLIAILALSPVAGFAVQRGSPAATGTSVVGIIRFIRKLLTPRQEPIPDYSIPLAGGDETNPEPGAEELEAVFVIIEDERVPGKVDEIASAGVPAQGAIDQAASPLQTIDEAVSSTQETPETEAEAEAEPLMTIDEAILAEAAVEEDEAGMFTVTLMDAAGEVLLATEIAEGELFTSTILEPAPDGYRFAYWYDETQGEETAYDFATPVTADVTLRAHVVSVEEGPSAMDILMIAEESTEAVGSVSVYSDAGEVLRVGQTVTLTAVVEGYEGVAYTLQWQQDSGSGWMDLPDANSETYTFPASAETMRSSWRVLMDVSES